MGVQPWQLLLFILIGVPVLAILTFLVSFVIAFLRRSKLR